MSQTTTPENDTDSDDCEDGVHIERAANDLTRIGIDARGHRHYHDAVQDRVVVTSADTTEVNHGILVYKRLDASPSEVDHVEDDISIETVADDWQAFVAQRRGWMDYQLTLIRPEDVWGSLEGF